jgi:hypothetical protein
LQAIAYSRYGSPEVLGNPSTLRQARSRNPDEVLVRDPRHHRNRGRLAAPAVSTCRQAFGLDRPPGVRAVSGPRQPGSRGRVLRRWSRPSEAEVTRLRNPATGSSPIPAAGFGGYAEYVGDRRGPGRLPTHARQSSTLDEAAAISPSAARPRSISCATKAGIKPGDNGPGDRRLGQRRQRRRSSRKSPSAAMSLQRGIGQPSSTWCETISAPTHVIDHYKVENPAGCPRAPTTSSSTPAEPRHTRSMARHSGPAAGCCWFPPICGR